MGASFLLRDGGQAVVTADKRTVATDALETLGTIIGPDEKRDAIHLAVEPAVAACDLRAGYHVGRMPDGRYGPGAVKLLGIVDPFIEGTVPVGRRFWLVVYPRQIASLRHVWTHPDFPEGPGVDPASSAPEAAASTRAVVPVLVAGESPPPAWESGDEDYTCASMGCRG